MADDEQEVGNPESGSGTKEDPYVFSGEATGVGGGGGSDNSGGPAFYGGGIGGPELFAGGPSGGLQGGGGGGQVPIGIPAGGSISATLPKLPTATNAPVGAMQGLTPTITPPKLKLVTLPSGVFGIENYKRRSPKDYFQS